MNRLSRSLRYVRGYIRSSMHRPLVDVHTLHSLLLADAGLTDVPSFEAVHECDSPTAFLLRYNAYTFLRKLPLVGEVTSQQDSATKKFLEAESSCKAWNQAYERHSRLECDSHLLPIFHRAARVISSTLGPVPSPDDSGWYMPPGASTKTRRSTSTYNKLRGPLEVTPHAIDRFLAFARTNPGWLENFLGPQYLSSRLVEVSSVVPGDRLHFVPKDVDTFRTIAIGPKINSILQRQLGIFMRHRLRKLGIFLEDAQVTHGALARLGSITGQLATVDLSSASDTISYNLILDLFPIDWVNVLDEVRSRRYLLDGRWRSYEKFSAMGNGFTFELQTLLFYSLAYACCEHLGLQPNVWVYGDDIIVPVGVEPLLKETFSAAGFTINSSKSFFHGQFRESCGYHYYNGLDVKPFYLKREATLMEIMRLHNYMYPLDKRYLYPRTMSAVRELLRPFSCLNGPPSWSTEDHIHDDRFSLNQSYYALQTRSKFSKTRSDDPTTFAYHMYRLYTRESAHVEDFHYGDLKRTDYKVSQMKYN